MEEDLELWDRSFRLGVITGSFIQYCRFGIESVTKYERAGCEITTF